MAVVYHQLQGSNATCPRLSVPRNKVFGSKQIGRTVQQVLQGTNEFICLQCKCNIVGAPFLLGPARVQKVTSFRGTRQCKGFSGASGSKFLKNSVKLSYVQQESEETLTELPQEVSVPSHSAIDETTVGSKAIQSLFRNWLTLLTTLSPTQVVDEALEELLAVSTAEIPKGMQRNGRNETLKSVWYSFWGLDATIKLPVLIFVSSFLAVNVVHGASVSKELTPLWVLGPIIVSLYVKMFRAISALYVFTFKKTVKVVKHVPTYYAVVRNYSASRKLKETLGNVLNMENFDVKKVSKRMNKDFNDWLTEKHLDFVESIWPTYCRTIRFMKRANLI